MALNKDDICTTCSQEDDDKAIYRIHPAIGIARLGDSEREFFLGPEGPGVVAKGSVTAAELAGDLSTLAKTPDASRPYLATTGYKSNSSSYRDTSGKIKRQAARFRIYQYKKFDVAGKPIWRCTGEITNDIAEIEWTVQLANTKGALKVGSPPLVHLTDDGSRDRVPTLKPDPEKIKDVKAHKRIVADGGTFGQIALGDLMLDSRGRLVVLGGHGRSAVGVGGSYHSSPDSFDDVSDGPVTVTIQFKASGRQIPLARIKPAWVVVGSPRYAPGLFGITTLYDRMMETWLAKQTSSPPDSQAVSIVERGHGIDTYRKMKTKGTPASYARHLKPVFQRTLELEWVFGPSRGRHPKLRELFKDNKADDVTIRTITAAERQNILKELNKYLKATEDPTSGGKPDDASKALENLIATTPKLMLNDEKFAKFRNYVFQTVCPPVAPYVTGQIRRLPAILTGRSPDAYKSTRLDDFQHTMPALEFGPRGTVAEQQYFVLRQWVLGNFEDGVSDKPFEHLREDPFQLDEAALENACGGPFYPGIEVGLLCTEKEIFDEPFRLNHNATSLISGKVKPGIVTQQMAMPWQADFLDCSGGPSGIYWPAQRPVDVVRDSRLSDVDKAIIEERKKEATPSTPSTLPGTARAATPTVMTKWADRSTTFPDYAAMVAKWNTLGFIVTKRFTVTASDGPYQLDGAYETDRLP
jgi:hypothetical protein